MTNEHVSGEESEIDFLFRILQLDSLYESGRYRDIYLNKDGTRIKLYGRDGGQNRYHFSYHDSYNNPEGNDSETDDSEGEDCKCDGCIITYQVPKHPNYIEYRGDKHDCVYSWVIYSVPNEYKEECIKRCRNNQQQNNSSKISD